jgi:hypothetical protein
MPDRRHSLLFSIVLCFFGLASLEASDFKVCVIDVSKVLDESDWGKASMPSIRSRW